MLILLTSCGVLQKDKEKFKEIGHDVVDEGVDDMAGK